MVFNLINLITDAGLGYNAADLTASITLFNGSMTIRELINVLPSVAAVNRNRPNWRTYVVDILGEVPSESRWIEVKNVSIFKLIFLMRFLTSSTNVWQRL